MKKVNFELWLLQEGEPVGSTILQLVVADKDTPKNGPPFSFHIVSGNEDRRFNVDQGGLLSLSAPLKKKAKPRHQLKIQVTIQCVIIGFVQLLNVGLVTRLSCVFSTSGSIKNIYCYICQISSYTPGIHIFIYVLESRDLKMKMRIWLTMWGTAKCSL